MILQVTFPMFRDETKTLMSSANYADGGYHIPT